MTTEHKASVVTVVRVIECLPDRALVPVFEVKCGHARQVGWVRENIALMQASRSACATSPSVLSE